jgi:uncharacterized protein YbaR (Trm112 family)
VPAACTEHGTIADCLPNTQLKGAVTSQALVIGEKMVSQELLEILRCPNCVREKDGLLKLYKDAWLVCQDCGRKYPIVDDIPVMLIDEGEKWMKTAEAQLPVPPPAK